jgi:HEAT repeat protein
MGASSLFADFLQRLDAGERLTFQDLKAAHPELSQRLRQLYEDWARLEELLPGTNLAEAPIPQGGDEQFLEVGAVFAGRYAIRRELGRGGFGVVYEAFDQSPLQRAVALKLIRFRRTAEAATAKARFLQEARLAGRLSHANIATILDVGEADGCVYMTQELAPGVDLQKLIARTGPLPLARVLAIVRQACEGLAHAHAHGVVHRDVKPSNLVVDVDDHVRITDFGLAQNVEVEGDESAGRVAGTPGYMAPEQLRGERVDSRADVFSLGCVLYTLLTNRPPFEGKTLGSIIDKTLHSVPPDPSKVREDLPRSLDRIVARALRKEADERYGDVRLLAQDLAHYQHFEYLLESGQAAAEIAASLRAGKCILFLGLDLPVRAGQAEETSAERALAELLAEGLAGAAGRLRLPQVAQDLEMERGRAEMLRRLAAVARNPAVSPRELLRRVARLPFRVVVTTAYDSFLEQELERSGKRVRHVLDARQAPDDLGGHDFVVNLFGRADQESSLAITEDDLWEFFGSFQSISDSLKSAFATRAILFVGFDAEDEHFRHLVAELLRLRTGTTESWHLPVTDPTLNAVRWAERKGVRLVDKGPGEFLQLLEEHLVEQKREESTRGGVPRAALPAIPARPYKFLNFYDGGDERIFCGRRTETLKMLSKIHAYPLNLLYAPSGSGKTSLIQAGLMPNLARENYLPVYARVYDAPAQEIRRSVLEASERREALAGKDELPFGRFLLDAAEANGRALVVFLDQFEEFFIRLGPEARARFGAELQASLRETRGQVRFVLCLREDYLARLSELRTQLPTIFHNEFRLGALDREAAKSAIVEPAELVGLEVEPALVEALLEDLAAEGVDPPQLQIVCDTLFDALAPGERRLTLHAYRALGGTRKILTGYLDRVLKELDRDERGPARALLKNLVTSEETKSVSRIADLARAVGCEERVALEILGELSERRLIRRIQREEGAWYELTHEYLAQEISRWLSEKERELKKVRELLEQALRNHRQLGLLMPPKQIQLVRRHEDDLNLSKEELQFLRQSERAVQKRRKGLVIATAAGALVALAAFVGGRYAYLDSHWFVRAEDRELTGSGNFLAETASFRFEGIDVYQGSPNQWWLDDHLGFPKRAYRTDFVLDEFAVASRDALKEGIEVSAATEGEELLAMLAPCDRVRHLALLSRIESPQTLLEPYSSPGVAEGDLDELTRFLAHLGSRFPEWASLAFESTLRRASYYDAEQILGNAVAFLPSDACLALLGEGLAKPRTRRAAIALLGAARRGSDVLVPFLEDPDEDTRDEAFESLCEIADCARRELLRNVVDGPQKPARNSLYYFSSYLYGCGDDTDLPRLEKLARAEQGQRGWFFERAYELAGSAAAPAVLRLVQERSLDGYELYTLATLDFPTFEPLILAALADPRAEARAAGARALAYRGDPSGLAVAAAIAIDEEESSQSRTAALDALGWFRGPQIQAMLEQALQAKEPELRSTAVRLLSWEEDERVVRLLVEALGDEEASVRSSAHASLKRRPSETTVRLLTERLGDWNPALRIMAARTLQALGAQIGRAVFEDFLVNLAGTTSDYDVLDWAVAGLRNALLDTPVSELAGAFRHPVQEMRLAGLMALLEHPDRAGGKSLLTTATEDADPRVRSFARRAQWALDLTEWAEAQVALARAALERGDLEEARRVLSRGWESAYEMTLGMGVARKYRVKLDRVRFDHLGFGSFIARRRPLGQELRDELDLRRGDKTDLYWLAEGWLSDDPSRAQALRDDPRFAALRDDYRFRVLTGMVPRRAVELESK